MNTDTKKVLTWALAAALFMTGSAVSHAEANVETSCASEERTEESMKTGHFWRTRKSFQSASMPFPHELLGSWQCYSLDPVEQFGPKAPLADQKITFKMLNYGYNFMRSEGDIPNYVTSWVFLPKRNALLSTSVSLSTYLWGRISSDGSLIFEDTAKREGDYPSSLVRGETGAKAVRYYYCPRSLWNAL